MSKDEFSHPSSPELDPDHVLPRPLRFELVRPSLLTLIEDSRDVPLTVLTAPSGFGKTTLLAQYARSRVASSALRPTAWLSLIEDDANPSILAARLARSLTAAVPNLTLECVQSAPHSALALAHDLNTAGMNFALALDRAERLGPEAGAWLETLLGALSEGHQLLLGGFDVPVRVARLAAQGRALVLGPADLAFGQEEAAAYLRARDYTGDATNVWASVEGWPAGLSLVAVGATPGLAPPDLVIEMLRHLPRELRRGLAEVSVLETWNAGAAARLGLQLPEGWLQAALSLGLPLTPLGSGLFRPHRLLREVLDAELRADPGRHTELHRRAAAIDEAGGMPLEAFGHYHAAGLGDESLRLALELVPNLVRRSEHHLVRRVLEVFDPARLPDPLVSALGVALIHMGDAPRGQTLLTSLRGTGRADVPALIALSELARREGRFEVGLALLDEAAGQAVDEAARAQVSGARAATLLETGALEQARGLALEMTGQVEAIHDPATLAQSLHLLGVAHQRLGELMQAERSHTRALSLYLLLDLPLNVVQVRIDLAMVQLVSGRPTEALEQLERGLPVAESTGGPLLAGLRAVQGDLQAWQGEHAAAAASYREAIGLSEASGSDTARFWLRLLDATRRSGDLPGAAQALGQARLLVAPTAWAQQRAQLAFQEGLLAFLLHNLTLAAEHFRAVGTTDPVSGLRAHLFLAELARLEGRLERDQAAGIVAQLEKFGSDAVLHLDAEVLGGLYAEFARRGWWKEHFSRWITPTVAELPAAVPLEVLSLGRLEVRVGGKAVHFPFARCGELLVWLALHGPASRDQIVNALWDGEPGHLEYFRVVVRKLRMVLAEAAHLSFNPLPFEHGHYGLAGRLKVRLDARELQQALASRVLERWQNALTNYRGDFLPGAQSEWASVERARLLDTAFGVALAVGGALEAADPAGALDAYRRAVEFDPLTETGHLGLIRVFTQVGDTASAEHARRAYARLLERELRADGFSPGRQGSELSLD